MEQKPIERKKEPEAITPLALILFCDSSCANDINVSRNRLFHLLITHADVAPGDGWAGVLQKPLDKHDVMPVVVVDASGVPLAETVCADVLVAKMVTSGFQMPLHLANRDREQRRVCVDVVFPSVVGEELVDLSGDGEPSLLPRLLLGHIQSVSLAVFHNVGQFEPQNVSNTHPQIGLGGEDRRYPFVGAATLKAAQKRLDDGAVLGIGKGYHLRHPQLFLSRLLGELRVRNLLLSRVNLLFKRHHFLVPLEVVARPEHATIALNLSVFDMLTQTLNLFHLIVNLALGNAHAMLQLGNLLFMLRKLCRLFFLFLCQLLKVDLKVEYILLNLCGSLAYVVNLLCGALAVCASDKRRNAPE